MSAELTPIHPQEPRWMTSIERAACQFVYHLAREVDAKQGKPPTRETQREVALEVSQRFFDTTA